MLQNLVGNAIKYALSLNDILHISISVSFLEQNYFPYAKIIVSDTGPGFTPEQLTQLNSGEKVVKKDGSHIGIYNSMQRLSILFAGKAKWRFYNRSNK